MLLLGEQDFAASNHDSFDANSLVMVTLRQATSGTSIPLYWPNLDLSGSGMRTWDIVATLTNSPATAPYTGNAFSVAMGITARCTTTGICTYTDTQSAATRSEE